MPRLDLLWDVYDELFGPLSLPAERSRRGRLLSEFRTWGRSVGYSDEQLAGLIRTHHQRMIAAGWVYPYLTERSVFNHWSRFESDTQPVDDDWGSVDPGITIGGQREASQAKEGSNP